jgi:hypothetical protein
MRKNDSDQREANAATDVGECTEKANRKKAGDDGAQTRRAKLIGGSDIAFMAVKEMWFDLPSFKEC